MAGDWDSEIEPSSMTFVSGGDNRQNYTVTFSVPKGSSTSDSRLITVGGSWTGSGGLVGDVQEDVTQGNVLQYYWFEISVTAPHAINATSEGTISVSIENTGNGEDTFRVEFANAGDLESSKWEIDGPVSVAIPEGGNDTVNLSVTTPSVGITYDLELTVTSVGSETDHPDSPEVKEKLLVVSIVGGKPPEEDKKDDDSIPWISVPEIALASIIALAMVHLFRRRTHR
jgi:uncharacterized membrane protein